MYRPSRYVRLLASTAIPAAGTAQVGTVLVDAAGALGLSDQATFPYGSEGTSADVWIQTTFDMGAPWGDSMQFAFTTASARRIL